MRLRKSIKTITRQVRAWLHHQPPPRFFSLLDVGGDTLKAGLVRLTTTETQLVGCDSAVTDGCDITGGRAEAEAIAEIANRLLTRLEDDSETIVGRKIVPDEVVLSVSSRVTLGQLFIVELKRPKPSEPISAAEMNRLADRAQQVARQDFGKLLAEQGHWQPLSLTQIGMQVDDNPVVKGIGLVGRRVTVSLFGIALETGVQRALAMLLDHLHLTGIGVLTSAQALATLLPQQQAIIIELGFSGTGLYRVRNGQVTAMEWLPVGGAFFSKSLAESAKLSLATAERLKQDFAADTLAPYERAWVGKHLLKISRSWLSAVKTVLTDLSKEEPLPRRVYLTGGGSQLLELDNLLQVETASFDSAPELLWLKSPLLGRQHNEAVFGVIAGLAEQVRLAQR